MKKVAAIFLSVVMVVMFCLPVSVGAAFDLSISVDESGMNAFGAGDVTIPVKITNNDAASITISSLQAGGSFSGSFSGSKVIAAGGSDTIRIPMKYSGRGQSLTLTVNGSYSTTLIVSKATETSSGNNNPGSDDDTEKSTDPKPYLYSANSIVFKAGDILPLPMKLNTQDGYADSVRMRLVGPEGKESMFSFYTNTGWAEVGELNGIKDVNPFIQVNAAVPAGTYSVTLEFEYASGSARFYNKDSKINITVHGKSDLALRVKDASFTLKEVGTDNKSKLNVNLLNPSASPYTDVVVSFNAEDNKANFSLYETFTPVSLGTLEGGKSKTATFSVYVKTGTTTDNYPMVFDVTYKDGTGTVVTTKETVPVQLTRTADADKDGKGSVPRIIVSKYSTDVEEIKAGQNFTLDFTLQNTSAAVAVSNIKVVIGSVTITGANGATSGEVFFPAEGSNSFYIANIASRAEVSNKIKLMAKQDVEPGVYAVELKLTYEYDKAATPETSTEQISFAVTQEQRLDIQGMNIPTDAMSGSGIPVNFQYINKGKATIYNLSVSVEGDFTLEGGSQYIGNLTAGYNDYFDNIIMPNGEGALKGTIILKYEDSSSNEKEQRTEFTCNVMAMDPNQGGMDIPGMKPGVDMPQEKNGVMSLVLWIGIPVLVLVVAGLAVLIILKKRKAKKELVRDEED